MIDSEEFAQHPQIEQLQKQTQSAQRETEKTIAELKDVYQSLATSEAAVVEQREKHLKQIRDLEKDKTDQSALSNQTVKEVQSHLQALDKLKQEMQALKTNLVRAKQDCEELRRHRKNLEVEKATLQNQLDQALDNEKKLLQQISDLKQEISYPWKDHLNTSPGRESGILERLTVSFASGEAKIPSTGRD